MAKILGTSIGKTSSILFLVLVIFISLALSNVSFLVSRSVAGPPLRFEGLENKGPKPDTNPKDGAYRPQVRPEPLPQLNSPP
jgi:hypothetical protein